MVAALALKERGLGPTGPSGVQRQSLWPPEARFVSYTGREWQWRPTEDRVALALAQRCDLPDIVGRLLASRGVEIEAAADFLVPTLRALMPDPSVLLDMDPAAERLADAVMRGETVAVFGDYDVDGACSAALTASLLRRLGCTVLTHVPDRMDEGYGPNEAALQRLCGAGATLVICVDCGTAHGAALAVLAGQAEAIVLDHHKAQGPAPAILATVNPNRLDDRSGLGTLCATAIAFLTGAATLRALRRRGFFSGARREPDLREMLDLVALATVCDVMPLAGLNRAFVAQGLRVMARGGRPGIAALLEVARCRGVPDAASCGFAIGPRINAAGRIDEAGLGLRLLLCEDPVEARALALRLDEVNRQRQAIEAGVLEAAMLAAEAQVAAGRPVLLVHGPDWHPGVVGIVAGRLRERFFRPVCVGGMAGDVVRGSGRSVPGRDLGAAVIAAQQAGHFLTGGGHAAAAGFSAEPARLAAAHDFLCERLCPDGEAPVRPVLELDASLSVEAATVTLAGHIARLAPFGPGNEEPLLHLPRARLLRRDRLGADGRTIRWWVAGESGPARLKMLAFRAEGSALAERLMPGGPPVQLVGRLRAEIWQERETAAFFLEDAAPA